MGGCVVAVSVAVCLYAPARFDVISPSTFLSACDV